MQLFGLLIKLKKMKKQLVMFVVIILICLQPIYSQILINTNKNMIGAWDTYTKKYTYGEVNPASITFKVYDSYISANDNTKSIYRVTKKAKDIFENDYKIFGWDCYDEKNRSCNFSITHYYDTETPDLVMILYPKYAYIYFIESFENLD
tara:strand:- start:5730 stop:6176 length:447 start_codon:yes stop_codon:yes gene_type:complete